MIVEDAVFLDETHYAAYCLGNNRNDDGSLKVYSTFQRNEVAQRWQRKDGSILITVRPKTKEESEKVWKDQATSLQKAIDEGRAVRDRIGRVKWKKH